MPRFLCHRLNWSLEYVAVPSVFKAGYVPLLLKRADLDPAGAKLYRPISNLSVTSKLVEKFVSKQLVKYLNVNDLLPDLHTG